MARPGYDILGRRLAMTTTPIKKMAFGVEVAGRPGHREVIYARR
jgi:hypothetical protein